MLFNDENYDIWYRQYKEQYKKTTKYIVSRGGSVRDTKPLTRSEFEIDFKSMAADNPKKSGAQIAKTMAKQELYETSFSQAKKFAEAHVNEFGGTVDINLIQRYRLGTETDIFETIRGYREQQKQAGFTNKKQLALMVSQEFFGSP